MIKITADSTCDLSPSVLKAMDITQVPLGIIVDGTAYHDGVDITPAEIFRYTEEGKTCKTAAVNLFEYKNIFAKLSPEYESIIHICIGSGFSSCLQNAVLAARDFQNVHVINSRNLSAGSGYIVYEAALMAKAGEKSEEIYRRLEDSFPKIDASFVIDSLDYLRRGGRCSGLEAAGAKLLKIKPCIEVIGGTMTVGKKYRGSLDVCLENYATDRFSGKTDVDFSRVFINHCLCPEQTVEKVKETVRNCARFEEIIETVAGCTIANHCGPNTVGIMYKRLSNKGNGTAD